MIEVFKTDVASPEQASKVLEEIRASFKDYNANFDLQDCDHILRVTSTSAAIYPHLVIGVLAKTGHYAEVLADEFQNIEGALQMP